MKLCLLLAGAIAAVLALSAADAAPNAPYHVGPHVTRAVLANGLRIAIVEDHSAPVVRVDVRYRFGTDDEPRGHDGLAHALEHMMFRGTHALSGSGLTDLQAGLGFDTNAGTGREETEYYQALPVQHLAAALRIEADRMRGLALNDAAWSSERYALLEEIREHDARPRDVLEDAVRARAYAGTPYAHGGTGTAAGMRGITTADLRRAYAAAYAPDNALLLVAGDVEPGAAIALARSVFGSVRGHATVRHAAQPAPRRPIIVQLAGGRDTLVDIALDAHGAASPEGTAEAIAAELLSPDHPTLTARLVDDGPCASYVVDDDSELHGGLYHVVCTLDADAKAARARHALRGVLAVVSALRALAAHPPHQAIARARRAFIDGTVFQCDDLAAEAELFGEPLSELNVDPRSIDRSAARVTDAQVVAVLRRWSTPVAVGAAFATGRGTATVEGTRAKTEAAPRPQRDEPVVQPAWARAALGRPLRLSPVPPADAFALPNGVQVFVDRRRGNGTVSLRAVIGDSTLSARRGGLGIGPILASGTKRWPRARITAVTDAREVTIELDRESTAHGFARDLPLMLDIISDAWRAPHAVPPAMNDVLTAAVRPERAWIAITGDVDPETVRALVTRDLAAWHVAAAQPLMPLDVRPTEPPGIHVLPGSRPTVRVFMALPVPGGDDPDSAALSLLNEVLGAGGGGFDTRLMRDLRTRRGLTYGTGSFYGPALDGYLVIGFECAPRDLDAARAVVYADLEGMYTSPPSAAQLERARRMLVTEAILARSTPQGRLDALAAARVYGVPDDPQRVLQRLAAVTPAEAARVARTYFQRDRIVEFDDRSR